MIIVSDYCADAALQFLPTLLGSRQLYLLYYFLSKLYSCNQPHVNISLQADHFTHISPQIDTLASFKICRYLINLSGIIISWGNI